MSTTDIVEVAPWARDAWFVVSRGGDSEGSRLVHGWQALFAEVERIHYPGAEERAEITGWLCDWDEWENIDDVPWRYVFCYEDGSVCIERITSGAERAEAALRPVDDEEVKKLLDDIRRILSFYTEPLSTSGACLKQAADLLERLSSRVAVDVPEGWKLVPVEATAENGMKAVLSGDVTVDPERDLVGLNGRTLTWTAIKRIYRQMIAASPSAPHSEEK